MGIWATWVPVGSVLIYNLAPVMVTSLRLAIHLVAGCRLCGVDDGHLRFVD